LKTLGFDGLREEIESAALLKVGTPGREVYQPETEKRENVYQR
jgi:hypothetical protein